MKEIPSENTIKTASPKGCFYNIRLTLVIKFYSDVRYKLGNYMERVFRWEVVTPARK
jgi:hypothetical protein